MISNYLIVYKSMVRRFANKNAQVSTTSSLLLSLFCILFVVRNSNVHLAYIFWRIHCYALSSPARSQDHRCSCTYSRTDWTVDQWSPRFANCLAKKVGIFWLASTLHRLAPIHDLTELKDYQCLRLLERILDCGPANRL